MISEIVAIIEMINSNKNILYLVMVKIEYLNIMISFQITFIEPQTVN